MQTGSRIQDRYLVHEQLGEETFIVINLSSGVKWILKELPFITSKETVQLLQIIRHPSLPRIFETFEIEGKTYFLLEYIEGVTLLELCDKHNGKLPYYEACEYMAVISRTLYFLHSQNEVSLLHLDIKPNNIIVTKNNLPCLIDYGSAQTSSEIILNSRHIFYGTPGYAPPEILQGETPTEQSDIFMIGTTLLRLITGIKPDPSLHIDAKMLTSMMPAGIAKIIQRCTMNNPGDRYGNASELAYDLEVLCNTNLCNETYPHKEYSTGISFQESDVNTQYNASSTKMTYSPVNSNDVQDIAINAKATEYFGKKKNSNSRVLCVWDNCQFAVELACVLSKHKKRVLLIDADLLSPGIDLLIEVKDTLGKSNRSLLGNSSLADLMEEYAKKRLSNETVKMFAQKTSIETLSCLCGNYRMEDYEYYSTEGLVEIIKTASMGYDFVVVACGKFIYDEFTCVSQICADLVYVPVVANCMQFREFNRYINFLAGRKQLEREKILFVAYDYQPNEDLSHGTCDELCNGAFVGAISYSQKRRMMQGTKKPYINAMETKIEKQYLGIIKKSNIFLQ